MRPKTEETGPYNAELFQSELEYLLNPKHPLVELSKHVDWAGLDVGMDREQWTEKWLVQAAA